MNFVRFSIISRRSFVVPNSLPVNGATILGGEDLGSALELFSFSSSDFSSNESSKVSSLTMISLFSGKVFNIPYSDFLIFLPLSLITFFDSMSYFLEDGMVF